MITPNGSGAKKGDNVTKSHTELKEFVKIRSIEHGEL